MKKTSASNPFSTGAGGADFERKIIAYFAISGFCGVAIPHVENVGKVTLLRLQARQPGRPDTFETDDCVLTFEDTDGHSSHLLIQAKHVMRVNKSDKEFKKALTQAWNDFCEDSFHREDDRIIFATGPASQVDTDDVRPIFEWARSENSASNFLLKFRSNESKNAKLQVIRELLSEHTEREITDQELWEFCRILSFMSFDFDQDRSKDRATVINLIHSNLIEPNANVAAALWNEACQYIATLNFNGGEIDFSNRPHFIATKLRMPVTAHRLSPWYGVDVPERKALVGRTQILKNVKEFLINPGVYCLVGIGGVGKTSIAYYVFQDLSENSFFCAWFDAEDTEELKNQYHDLALELQLPGVRQDTVFAQVKRVLLTWLAKENCLLIYDNAIGYTQIAPYFPKGKAVVLATSQNKTGWAKLISVPIMTKVEALELLNQLLEGEQTHIQEEKEHLVELLQYLPLAIAQSAAYIKFCKIPISDYLLEYQGVETRLRALQDRTFSKERNEHKPVWITWDLVLGIIQKDAQSKNLTDLMYYCALMQSNNIPRSFLRYLFAGSSEYELNYCFGTLNSYSLIELSEKHIAMHRVLQHVLIEKLRIDITLNKYLESLLEALQRRFEYNPDNPSAFQEAHQLRSHVAHVLKLCERYQLSNPNVNHVQYRLGLYFLHYLNDCKSANKHFSKAALNLRKDSWLASKIKHQQVKVLIREKRYNEAQALLETEPLIDTVSGICTLIDILLRKKDKTGSEDNKIKELLDKAQEINESEKQSNIEDEETALILHYRGRVSFSKKYYSDAIIFFEKSLEIKDQCCDPKNIHISYTLFMLAKSHWRKKEYESAVAFSQRALQIKKDFYDEVHEEIVDVLEMMGKVYFKLHRFALAEDVYSESLHLRNQLGKPNMQAIYYLAEIFIKNGNQNEALCLITPIYEDYQNGKFSQSKHKPKKWIEKIISQYEAIHASSRMDVVAADSNDSDDSDDNSNDDSDSSIDREVGPYEFFSTPFQPSPVFFKYGSESSSQPVTPTRPIVRSPKRAFTQDPGNFFSGRSAKRARNDIRDAWYSDADLTYVTNLIIASLGGYHDRCHFLLNLDEEDAYQENGKNYCVLVTPAIDTQEMASPIDFYFDKSRQQAPDAGRPDDRRDIFDEVQDRIAIEGELNIKILFPYNITNAHWLSGEVTLHRENNSHVYTVTMTAHDPYGQGSINQENYQVIRAAFEKRIKQIDQNATFQFSSTISPYGARQANGDGISCGVIVAEDLHSRILGASLYQEVYPSNTMNLREYHLMLATQNNPGDPNTRRLREKYESLENLALPNPR